MGRVGTGRGPPYGIGREVAGGPQYIGDMILLYA